MSEATIVLTVKTDTAGFERHLEALIAAARDGFKVDGWEVVETQGIYGQPFADGRCGNFEEGDGVTVAPYVEGVSFIGLDPDNRADAHELSGDAVVIGTDVRDGTVQVAYDDNSRDEWVHHTSLRLR